jgi:hypothetical protein
LAANISALVSLSDPANVLVRYVSRRMEFSIIEVLPWLRLLVTNKAL